jgi:hypothetical protein
MPATFEVLWPLCAVELNGNQVKQPLNINPPAGFIQRFLECLGCPRNGKQVWAYRIRSAEQEVFRKTLGWQLRCQPSCQTRRLFQRTLDATVNAPIHGKVIRQILRARIPALNAYGNIAWGGILIDICSLKSLRGIFLFSPGCFINSRDDCAGFCFVGRFCERVA